MGDQHQGRAALFVEFEQQVADALAGVAVEVAGGFIGKQHVRFCGKGTGNRHPLLLATGKLAWRVGQALAQAYTFQQVPGAFAGVFAAVQLQRQHDVFQRVEAVEQLERLEHEAHVLGTDACALVFVQGAEGLAGEGDFAAAGQVEAGQQAQESGFAGTGAADDSQAIALVQFQAQFVQDSQFTFRAGNHFAKVPRGENACAHGESDANVVFECWPGLDVHGPERSGGYSPDRWR